MNHAILGKLADDYVVIGAETPVRFLQSSITFSGLQFSGLKRN